MFVPLDGVRILDLTRLLPGPYCTWLLASLGASVLRLEDPRAGDYTRQLPPAVGRHGAMFHVINRGKRSIAVDLRADDGRLLLEDLLAHHDVLVEGFRPGTLARLGLDPEALRERWPGLVICSISGYGQHGPRASRAGHDLDYQALAGVLGMTGGAGGPSMPGIPLADLSGALNAALAIVAALFRRERSGEGAWLDISLTEAVAAMAAPLRAANGFPAEDRPGEGMLDGGLACYGLYRTRDGRYLAVAALEPKFWMQLCGVLGHPEWANVPPLPGPEQRRVRGELAALLATRTRDAWARELAAHDLCVEPVLEPDEAVADEHAIARGAIEREGDAVWARPTVGAAVSGDSPALGEHAASVLAEIGYDEDRVARLRGKGVIG